MLIIEPKITSPSLLNRWCFTPLLFVVAMGLSLLANAAEETPGITFDLPPAEEHAAPEHGDEYAFHHHHLGLFLGYAVKDADKIKDGFKVGLEYEYQFIKWLGVRGFADYEAGDLDKWLFGGGASFHVPKTGLGIFTGGGVETHGGHSDSFFRLSAEYKFKLNDKWSVAPAVGYDFGRDESGAFFVGAMLGFGF